MGGGGVTIFNVLMIIYPLKVLKVVGSGQYVIQKLGPALKGN